MRVFDTLIDALVYAAAHNLVVIDGPEDDFAAVTVADACEIQDTDEPSVYTDDVDFPARKVMMPDTFAFTAWVRV